MLVSPRMKMHMDLFCSYERCQNQFHRVEVCECSITSLFTDLKSDSNSYLTVMMS